MKKPIIFAILLALCLAGCGGEQEKAPVVSTVSTQDCFLCGSGAGKPFYWGQDNIGIVELNTFEVMPIAINRYDGHGTLIEESTGCLNCRFFPGGDSGLSANVFEDVDRGYAMGSIAFPADHSLRAERMAGFLCQACLDTALSTIFEEGFGVGVVNFSKRTLRPLEASSSGFALGDYYIHLTWKELQKPGETWGTDFFVCFCPPRYDAEKATA